MKLSTEVNDDPLELELHESGAPCCLTPFEDGTETERQRERERDRETGRQGDRETRRQGDRETGRQGDRGRGRERERQRERERECERVRESERVRETKLPFFRALGPWARFLFWVGELSTCVSSGIHLRSGEASQLVCPLLHEAPEGTAEVAVLATGHLGLRA